VQLRSVCDDIDPGSPFAMMFRTFLLSLAEWFLRNLSEEVIKGQVRMFADKRYIGKAPFGYVMRNPKSKQSQLIPGADARFVVQAYELYLAGATYVDIARQINAIVGSEVLTEQSVRHMLSNKIYRGIKQGRILDPDETKKTIVVEQYFPALDIVEADLWTRVQQRRATYGRRPQSPQRKAHGHLLSGLVHCDSCDGPLDGNWSAGERRYYRCRTRARRATKNACPQVSVRASDLDAHVVLIVHRLHAHLTDLTDARLRAYLDTDVSKGAARVRIAQLEDFLRRLTETYLAGDIAPDRYKADKEAGKAELHACQDHLDVALECALERVMAAVRLVPLDIPYRDMAQLGVINDALHHIISKIRVRGHTIVEVTYSDLAIQLCAALDIAPETLWVATTPKVPHSAPVDIEGTRQLAMFGPEGSDASTPLCPVRGRHRRTPARSRAAVVTCTPEQMTLWTSGEPCLGHVLPDSGERGR